MYLISKKCTQYSYLHCKHFKNVVLVLVDDTFKNVEFMHCKSLRNVFEKYYNTRNLRVWLQNGFFLELGGVFYFLYTLGKLAKRGGGWLPSGATKGG